MRWIAIIVLGSICAPTYANLPTTEFVESMCALVSDKRTRNKVFKEGTFTFLKESADINNDGETESIKESYQGTMVSQVLEFFDQNGNTLFIRKTVDEWRTYGTHGASIFSYRDKTFRISNHPSSGTPSHITYTTPDNVEHVVCDFKTYQLETTLNTNHSCRDAVKRSNQWWRTVTLPDRPTIAYEEVRAFGIHEAHPYRQGWVNIDNDWIDTLEQIVEIDYASGAGRGCDTRFFLLLNDEGNAIAESELQTKFLELQAINLDHKHPAGCTGKGNVLMQERDVKGTIAVDVREASTRRLKSIHGPSPRTPPRQRKDGFQLHTHCTFETEYVSEIKSIFPRPDQED